MDLFQNIRRKATICRVLLGVLALSILLMPFASWSTYSFSTQVDSHVDNVIEMDVKIDMANCRQLNGMADQQTMGMGCCKNNGSDLGCKDCPKNCVSTVYYSFFSDEKFQHVDRHIVVHSIQSVVSSREIPPPFRPPIQLLS